MLVSKEEKEKKTKLEKLAHLHFPTSSDAQGRQAGVETRLLPLVGPDTPSQPSKQLLDHLGFAHWVFV